MVRRGVLRLVRVGQQELRRANLAGTQLVAGPYLRVAEEQDPAERRDQDP
jgi:hypothetical protein